MSLDNYWTSFWKFCKEPIVVLTPDQIIIVYGENDYQSTHFHKLVGHIIPVLDYSDDLLWVVCNKFVPFNKDAHVYRYYSAKKYDYYRAS